MAATHLTLTVYEGYFSSFAHEMPTNAVPEPATIRLLGLLGLAGARRTIKQ